MASKNLTRAIAALCGSLLAMTTATQAADQPAKQITTSDPTQDTLVCRDLDIPGSHIKSHVCGVPAKLSEAQTRLYLMRVYPAASHPYTDYSGTASAGWGGWSPNAGPSGSVQR